MATPYDSSEIKIENFKGTFDRGRDEIVPPDHFIESLNLMFDVNTIRSRDPFEVAFTEPDGTTVFIVRHFYRRAEGIGNVLLYLTNQGNLFGVRNGIRTLLLSNALMTDFSITDTFNRIYVSPHNRVAGISGEKVYWWDGTTFLPAAGAAPTASSAMLAVTAAAVGVNEVQTLTIGTPTGGNIQLDTVRGITSPLPFNMTAAQIHDVLFGDNERQSIFIRNAAGGTWTGEFGGQITAGIANNASAATVQAAFEALSTIGTGNISVSGAGTQASPWVLTFQGTLARIDQPMIIVNGSNLTGTNPEIAIQETLRGRRLFENTVTGTNPFTITFVGASGEQDQPLMGIINNLSGGSPTATIVETTKGEFAGKIEKGVHKFAVAFETQTGFITPPGPKIATVFTPTVYTAPGGKEVDLSNIPIGPTGTSARHIIATKAGGEEYFFIPNGRIANNTATTLSGVDFFDTELVDSADHLFDLLETIPACLKLVRYRNRLALTGFPDALPVVNSSILRISREGSIESFDTVDGVLVINQDDRHKNKNMVELRDILYVFKTLGVYATQDNGQEPAFWDVTPVDRGVGTEVFGISEIPNVTGGTTKDRILVADASGLLLFDGIFRRPELTWKINDIWVRIRRAVFNTVQVWDDPVNQFLYINVPLITCDDLTPSGPNLIIHGDYSESPDLRDPFGIKWTMWKVPTAPLSISVFDLEGAGQNPIFRYSGFGFIFKQCPSYLSRNDPGPTAIEAFLKTYLMPVESPGSLNNFHALRFKVDGEGSLTLTLVGYDNTNSQSPPSITLSQLSGREKLRIINFIGERMSLKIGTNALNAFFNLFEIKVFGKEYSVQRPA